MTLGYILLSISFLSIVMGFVALLTQRIYLDASTQEKTEIELPLFGKMKTNYPALIFVFLGFALSFYVFDKCYPPQKEPWELSGQFISPGRAIDWETGSLSIFPSDYDIDIDEKGFFMIKTQLDEGVDIEAVVQSFMYSHKNASIEVFPLEEYRKYTTGAETSLIDRALPNSRKYKPVPVNIYENH